MAKKWLKRNCAECGEQILYLAEWRELLAVVVERGHRHEQIVLLLRDELDEIGLECHGTRPM
jgi:hypothetical protein